MSIFYSSFLFWLISSADLCKHPQTTIHHDCFMLQTVLSFKKIIGKAHCHRRYFKIVQTYNKGTIFVRWIFFFYIFQNIDVSFWPVGHTPYAIMSTNWILYHMVFLTWIKYADFLKRASYNSGHWKYRWKHLVNIRLENFSQTSLWWLGGGEKLGLPTLWQKQQKSRLPLVPTALQPEMWLFIFFLWT